MTSLQAAQAGSSKSNPALPSEAKRSFASLGVPPSLVGALSALFIVTPTQIQRESLPSILSGLDLIAGSPTGSGKTLSFALPILIQLALDMVAGFAVVLTPTRELAAQLHQQFVAVAQGAQLGVRTALVLGGEDMMMQAKTLAERPNVLVATPGRLADLLSNGEHEALRRCKYVVLDEADRLLTPTFAEPLATIFAALPPASSRQTLLFSATLTPQIEALAERPRQKGERQVRVCRIEGDTTTPPQLKQHYIFIPSHIREPFLYHLLLNPPHQATSTESDSELDEEEDLLVSVVPTIIFTSRCRTAALLSRMLSELGLPNVALHSYLPQSTRTANLQAFRATRSPILITTDVGSRGLDVPEVRLVVNWDLPRDWRDYVHRVGRTARAGRDGTAISFVGERDVELLKAIEENIGVEMTEHAMSEETVLEKLNAVSTAKRVASVALHDAKFGQLQERNKQKACLDLTRSGEAKKVKKQQGKKAKAV